MTEKETLVVVNPAAGGGRAGYRWERVAEQAQRLADLDAVMPAGAEATRAAIAAALDRGCRRVVAFGGDGTAHLVANALLAAGAGHDVTFGVVAAGTGSDLARALSVPRDVLPALTRALLGKPAPMDAGHCESERGAFHFINIASAGIGGQVDETVNALPQRGTTAFLRATLAALRRYRCVPVRIALDGAAWYEGPILLAAFANGTCFGKGMRAAPQARTDDGLLDVVVAGEIGGPDLIRRLLQLYLGRHLDAKPVRWARARTVRLEPLAPLPVFDADGETYPSGPATFTVLPAALRVAAPLAVR